MESEQPEEQDHETVGGRMANGNSNGKVFKWIATIAILALLTAAGIIRASDRADIDSNTVHVTTVVVKMDSLITELRVEKVRDSFFRAAVLQALGSLTRAAGVTDTSDSN